MKRTLVQIYRNSDLYTLYYDQADGEFYKIPFRKKSSFTSTYLVVIALIVASTLFNKVYENYQSIFLDVIFVIVGVAIACFLVNKLFQSYYMEENIRHIYLDDSHLESCVKEGVKQSKREIPVLIISFLLAVASFYMFLFANNPKLLIVGSLSTACFLAFNYMKPLKRRKIIKIIQKNK